METKKYQIPLSCHFRALDSQAFKSQWPLSILPTLEVSFLELISELRCQVRALGLGLRRALTPSQTSQIGKELAWSYKRRLIRGGSSAFYFALVALAQIQESLSTEQTLYLYLPRVSLSAPEEGLTHALLRFPLVTPSSNCCCC